MDGGPGYDPFAGLGYGRWSYQYPRDDEISEGDTTMVQQIEALLTDLDCTLDDMAYGIDWNQAGLDAFDDYRKHADEAIARIRTLLKESKQ